MRAKSECQREPSRRRVGVTCVLATWALGAVLAWPGLAAGQYTRISRAADGTPGNGDSYGGRISADGSSVVFVSTASNLVPGDTNGRADVFVKHLATGAIERVSVNSDGTQRAEDSGTGGVDLSADGRVVAFTSAEPLRPAVTGGCRVASETPVPCPNVYVHDRVTHTTTPIGRPGSDHPRISDDGRFVTFASSSAPIGSVFLVDRVAGTTRRLSEPPAGGEANGASYAPEISADGQVVMFLSEATNLDASPDPLPCAAGTVCRRVFVYDASSGATTRVPFAPTLGAAVIEGAAMDASGRMVAAHTWEAGDLPFMSTRFVWLYDRQLRRQSSERRGASFSPHSLIAYARLALSGDGISVAYGTMPADVAVNQPGLFVSDRLRTSFEGVPVCLAPLLPFDLSQDGRALIVSTACAWDTPSGPYDPWTDVFVYTRDADGDGLADEWERRVGLDPADPADAALDPDHDGRTSLAEYRDGTHPRTAFTGFLAEGSASGFFSTRIVLANPDTSTASVAMRLLGSTGEATGRIVTIGGRRRVILDFGAFADAPGPEFGIVLDADRPLAAERTMTWDATAYGSHAETAVRAPATRWVLAEGATHGTFDTFYLLLNPGADAADVAITYLRPAPAPTIVKTYRLLPHSRRTIPVDAEDPGLAGTDVAADIASSAPIVVERAVYWNGSGPAQPYAAGLVAAGVAPAPRWVLAEGATGAQFDLYYLVANPAPEPTRVRVTYLLPAGAPLVREYPVAGRSRLTIAVDHEAPALADTTVSAIVESLDGTGIAVERSMWWPGDGRWTEGHLSAAASAASRRWLVADGQVSATTDTYLLVVNPTPQAGIVTFTIFGGETPAAPAELAIPPFGRLSVPLRRHVTANGDYAVQVESSGPEVVVERATYTTANGVPWAAGGATLATPLP